MRIYADELEKAKSNNDNPRYTGTMTSAYKIRRTIIVLITVIVSAVALLSHPNLQQSAPPVSPTPGSTMVGGAATDALAKLEVKGRAPKTGYERAQFGDGWGMVQGCDMRNIILHRDLVNTQTDENGCKIVSGHLNDPYTNKQISFIRGETTSDDVQIDHVVALSNAWQTGAQSLTAEQRIALANDPLELLAVDGEANQQKSDGDAATWLPPNKAFRCQYVARQTAVKVKYQLWVTAAEKDAMARVLSACPGQTLPVM